MNHVLPVRPYRRAAFWIGYAWLAGTLAIGILVSLVVGFDSDTVTGGIADGRSVLMLSISSGVIAMVALVPGILLEQTDPAPVDTKPGKMTQSGEETYRDDVDGLRSEPSEMAGNSSLNISNAFLLGMMIRTLGTVALFFGGTYTLRASPGWIAFWVLIWHVALLAVEVIVVARSTPRLDH